MTSTDDDASHAPLRRTLGWPSLTAYGLGAILGAEYLDPGVLGTWSRRDPIVVHYADRDVPRIVVRACRYVRLPRYRRSMLLAEDPAVDLATPSGPMRTYVYRPVAPAGMPATRTQFPGVVLYSEIYQRTGPIHRLAMIIAGHGFLVAVPEIFHELEAPGTVLAYDKPGTERGNANKIGKAVASYDADTRAVLDFLAASPHCTGQLGAMGVCIGGHLAFRAALQPDVRATACFYATDLHKGSLGAGGDDSLARVADVSGELLMVWGRQDPHIPDEGRAMIQRRLAETGRLYTWHEWNAQHAFLRDEGPRYDPALALLSYQLVAEMFRRVLTG